MPSARELKMRQMLEQKKQALQAKQQEQQSEIVQKASSAPVTEKFSPEFPYQSPSQSAKQSKLFNENKKVKTQKPFQETEGFKELQTITKSEVANQPPKASAQKDFRFQAIGAIFGQVRQNTKEEFWVDFDDGRTIRLWVRKSQQAQLLKTLQEETSLYLNVYPKVWFVPNADPQLYLYVIQWFTPSAWEQKSWSEEIGIFVLRGIWRFHPQSKCNVMTIYRNTNAFDPSGRYKASHLPVEMERDDICAFRYQPKQRKDERSPRWFVQGRFRLNQDLAKLQWFEDIAPPTTDLPQYKKKRNSQRISES